LVSIEGRNVGGPERKPDYSQKVARNRRKGEKDRGGRLLSARDKKERDYWVLEGEEKKAGWTSGELGKKDLGKKGVGEVKLYLRGGKGKKTEGGKRNNNDTRSLNRKKGPENENGEGIQGDRIAPRSTG